jgi:hypothetical protein
MRPDDDDDGFRPPPKPPGIVRLGVFLFYLLVIAWLAWKGVLILWSWMP